MRTRLLLVATAGLLCGAVVGTLLLLRDGDPGGLRRVDADMTSVIERHGWTVVPDESATEEAATQARSLAKRFGPRAGNPERRVAGIALARVADHQGDLFEDRLVWVVVVEGVVDHCFGPADACGKPEPLSTEVTLVDPETLTMQKSKVF